MTRVLAFFIACILLTACGGPTPDAPSDGSTGTPAERPALEAIPAADITPLSAEAQENLAQERATLDGLLAESNTAHGDLAEQFGSVGQLYQAYGLVDAAAVCYRNAQALDPEAFPWPYLLGTVAQVRGDADAALAALGRARALRPDDLPTLLRLANLHLDIPNLEQAEAVLAQAREEHGESAAVHFGLGRLASSRDDSAKAITHFERALELQPRAKNVHYTLGLAHRKLGDREQAEYHLGQMNATVVVFEDPLVDSLKNRVSGIGPHIDEAINAIGDGDIDRAVEAYKAALEVDGENVTALRGLGFALRTAGRQAEAAEALRNMLALYPDHSLAHLELGTVLMEKGDFDAAIPIFDRALELDPNFEQAHINRGVTLGRAGRWGEAAESFRNALAVDDRNQHARYQLAVAMEALGRGEEGFALLQEVVREQPDMVEARQRLGHALMSRGDLDGAVAEHRAVIDLDGAPRQEKALAHYQLGLIATQRADLTAAAGHFRQSKDLFPEFWQAGFALGNTLMGLGKPADAVAEYRQVREKTPGNLQAMAKEAEALMRANRWREAGDFLAQGLNQNPRSAELGHQMARLLAIVPEPSMRNPQRALQMAGGILQAHQTVEHAETLAMALAAAGQFDQAVDLQQQVIANAQNEGRDGAHLRVNLEKYRRGEPVVGY